MNSQNILLEGVIQALSPMPIYLWVVILIALLLSFFSKFIAKLFLPKFTTKPLLNKSEIRLFKVLQQVTPSGFHLYAQVSYGEFLRCANNKKFWTINAKRADFVICDIEFNVVAVIEYQGRGHQGSTSKSQKNAKHRDSVKRNALIEVNIPMIEIFPKFDQASVSESLDFVFNPPVEHSYDVRTA